MVTPLLALGLLGLGWTCGVLSALSLVVLSPRA